MLVECANQLVVAAGDRLAQSERVVGLEREKPACLVELVEGDRLLGEFESAARVAAFQACVAARSTFRVPAVRIESGYMEPAGIEPATSCLQSRRSPS